MESSPSSVGIVVESSSSSSVNDLFIPFAEMPQCINRFSQNFIIMSDSGKPIFSTLNDTSEAQICSILQAIQISTLHYDIGDIQSLRSDFMLIFFMRIQAVTLIAVSTTTNGRKDDILLESETYLRLRLEYLYSQIIFTLTDCVQTTLAENSTYNIQSVLLPSFLQSIVSDAKSYEGGNDPASMMNVGVQTVFPLSNIVRQQISMLLKQIGDDLVNMVAALLVTGIKIVTLIQSPYRPHQLRTTDVQLLLHFMHRPSMLQEQELWLPLCFPRLYSSGFLHCYACCLDSTTKLTLCFVSTCGSMEQFHAFRKESIRVRSCLNIDTEAPNVIEALTFRSNPPKELAAREDNNIAYQHDQNTTCRVTELPIDCDYELIPSFETIANPNDDSGDANILSQLCPELSQISKELEASTLEGYLNDGILHFFFRLDVPIFQDRGKSTRKGPPRDHNHPPGYLIQWVSPALGSVARFSDHASQRRVWNMYQRLQLRLRSGFANTECLLDAFCAIPSSTQSAKVNMPTIEQYCLAMSLVESPPMLEGITYISDGLETFLAMNGQGFEL